MVVDPVNSAASRGGRIAAVVVPRADTPESRSSERPLASSARLGLGSGLRDFVALTKPRIVAMILITTIVAAMVASGAMMPLLSWLHLVLGVGMVAGSAGAMNQVWERAIDGRMQRTCRRPLPSGRMTAPVASGFSAALGVIGTFYLAGFFGPAPAVIGLLTWVLYVPIYTPMKVRSAWNTTVGAISGALPIMIGYTAAGGALTDVRGWLLVGVLVAWQYPHFMAIAWLYRRQYAEAGFRMTTTVEPTGRSAGVQSVVGMIVLSLCSLTLVATSPGTSWWMVLICGSALLLVTLPMLRASVAFAVDPEDGNARKLLRASLLQLPASLLVITIAAMVG